MDRQYNKKGIRYFANNCSCAICECQRKRHENSDGEGCSCLFCGVGLVKCPECERWKTDKNMIAAIPNDICTDCFGE